jgi:hypothetical protein
MLAARLRYDLRRAAQLHALADGFDRLAERVEAEALARKPNSSD